MKFDCGNGSLWLGDCLDLMKHVPNGSVDMVLCDLPYGTTLCKWDAIIPFEPLWKQYWRICKPNGAVVLTASQPFTSALIMSQINAFKYEWIWKKNASTGFAHAKNKPLKNHENICVFSNGVTIHASQSSNRTVYNPQMTVGKPYKKTNSGVTNKTSMIVRPSHDPDMIRINNGERYPISVQDFNLERGFHPTQKPVTLFEYLIKTYTNPGDLVLDNCSGSGTTAIAAQQCGRRWLCIEKELEYYLRSAGRIHAAVNE